MKLSMGKRARSWSPSGKCISMNSSGTAHSLSRGIFSPIKRSK
jgi:hypothetical protein